MFRPGGSSGDRRVAGGSGVVVGGDLEDNLASLTQQQQQQQQQEDQLSDDDNAAPEMQSEMEEVDKEDPFQMALDDLEGRVVSSLDDIKLHPGVRSDAAFRSAQDELATLLRPVMEVAAHTAPSIARTYYQAIVVGGTSSPEAGVEASCEEVYQRVVSDLVLPVLLEMAQSDTIPAKRGASLEFFRGLYKECQKPGSWLDSNYVNAAAGPYGSGNVPKNQQLHQHAPSLSQRQPSAQLKRRQAKRLQREGEILRYWVQASIACTQPGAFTADASEAAVASRGVIAASASIRPSLKHIAQRIRDADDRGANRIFGPVMKMVEGVLKKLFLSTAPVDVEQGDALRSSCIKFLEIACLCCSAKPQDASSRRKGSTPDDFSLEDLPAGHPIITREALESIAEYAFSALRGLNMMGGQVKIDVNLLSDMLLGDATGLPSAQVVSILKPAALAYLEIESTLPPSDGENALEIKLDRSSIEFDFVLSHKSYALTVNAISTLASNRPVFFKEGAVCLARRCGDPPTYQEEEGAYNILSKPSVLAIRSQIKASCLTLLRNALSVQTKSSYILHKVLKETCDMEIQADKALKMAEQTTALKTAGRAARNRANMFYEWDTTADERTSKRQRETDDALAKMRAAKAARGLGHGIQLPTSTVDAIELILENLKNVPPKRPAAASSSKRKSPISLDILIDAIITNGASLVQEEGRWYSRDGGSAWSATIEDGEQSFELSAKGLLGGTGTEEEQLGDQKKIFVSQCQTAASEALGRIVVNSLATRNGELSEFASGIAARLAWTLGGVPPASQLQSAHDMALDSIQSSKRRIDNEEKQNAMDKLAKSYPLVTSCLALPATSTQSYGLGASSTDGRSSLTNAVMNEAYIKGAWDDGEDSSWKYDASLNVFAGSVLHASERCNDKPTDGERKRVANDTNHALPHEMGILPYLNSTTLDLVGAMCDLDAISKKASEAVRKNSQQTIAASAALHAAKQAAEKRATTALLVLRDACFQRSNPETRKSAIRVAVSIAAGQKNTSPSCEDKALKLVMNMMYPRSDTVADDIVEAAIQELEAASKYAQMSYGKIQKSNRETKAKEGASETSHKGPFAPESEEEKAAMGRVRKPIVLFMALCIRRQELINTLFALSSVDKADVLAKTVKQQMLKLAKAAGIKHGTAEIALNVAKGTTPRETPLLLSFLDTLAPVGGEKGMVSQEFIDACFKIRDMKAEGGSKSPKFLIPVVVAMKREDLIARFGEFVDADDAIFLAALVKMAERLGRQALLFRDEPDPENPSLVGMTHCEQLVFLHKLDFEAAGLPQRRYLDAIRACLDNEEIFNDRVVMSALDHMSGTFLTGHDLLPLAFMRTCILVCSKHESLHSWICHILLPRLIEGKIYEDKRQWEGWMRCAKMLENSADTGVSSKEAIEKLPLDQLDNYRARYGS